MLASVVCERVIEYRSLIYARVMTPQTNVAN